jgi:hypothetical protein
MSRSHDVTTTDMGRTRRTNMWICTGTLDADQKSGYLMSSVVCPLSDRSKDLEGESAHPGWVSC